MPYHRTLRTLLCSAAVATACGLAVPVDAAAATVFDFTMSIHDSPAGDDDATVDDGANDAEQRAYEEMLRHFADSVCEQSNGTHHVGKVRIFKNGDRSGSVDINWGDTGRPGAHTTGFGKSGWQIFMYDNFGSIKISDGGDDLQRLGYILGHEAGHYVYGVYDEYREAGRATGTRPSQPISSDVPVDQAIMNRGREAVNGNFNWLNHSTQNNIGDTDETAQGRVYGKSGWDTLIQTTASDPTTVDGWAKPTRTHYSDLVGAEPTATDNWFKVELPGGRADCRTDLEILWVEDLEIDIVLDRSGSMAGQDIANAKSAATSLIDLLEPGSTAAGVTSFSTSVTSDAPITAIPVPGTTEKNALKNAIAGITAGGGTNIFDSAVFSLNKLQNFASTNSTNASQIVFLLSDGLNGTSTETLSSTTAKFQAAGVPIFTFGYGTSFDQDLVDLANNTGGSFTQSPTTAAEIQNAFSAAFAAVSGAATLASAAGEVDAGTTERVDFVIDDTILNATVTVTYTGSLGDATLSIESGGTNTLLPFDCSATGSTVNCSAQISESDITSLGTGDFQVVIENASAGPIDGTVNIIATPKDGGTYTLNLDSQNGSSITYPEPIIVSMVLSRDLPITGAAVTAAVTAPDGSETQIDLNDDGVGADRFAGDALYSGWVPYSGDGTYNLQVAANNNAGTATYSDEALSEPHYGAQPEPGDTVTDPTLPAGNFSRAAGLQLNVSGVAVDDHEDDPTSGACTVVTPDNTHVDGKIDAPGDVDCFDIGDGSLPVTDPITVRAFNSTLGTDPQFTVFASDGTTEIATADPAVLPPSDGALFIEIDAADIDPNGMIMALSDTDPTFSGGNYSVSAGPALPSDVESTTGDGGGGGGAVGPLMLWLMGLLGLGGLVARRRRLA